jgi:hypothetical protein
VKITLGNTVIVDTLDQASGVWPGMEQSVEVAGFLRGAWKKVFPCGNRMYTLPVTVWDLPHPGVGASMVAMFTRLQDLPTDGLLTIEEHGMMVRSPHAVVQSGRVVKRVGLSDGYELTLLIEGPLSAAGEELPGNPGGGGPDTIVGALATLADEELTTLAGEILIIL